MGAPRGFGDPHICAFGDYCESQVGTLGGFLGGGLKWAQLESFVNVK